MNMPVVIDVMLGLVLIYCLLSLIASTVVEMWSSRCGWRNEVLKHTVERLLVGEGQAVRARGLALFRLKRSAADAGTPSDNADAKDPELALSTQCLKAFWEHPVISRLRASGTDAPAYMEGERFATAVLDIATGQGRLGVVPNTIPGLRSAILAQTGGEMERGLLALLRTVSPQDADPRARLGEAVALWYKEAMDRSSGVYRRKVQLYLFWLGLVMALLLNLDSVRIVSVLSTDSALRGHMAEMAVKLDAEQQAAVTPVSKEKLQKQVKDLRDLSGEGFPIGWVSSTGENFRPVVPESPEGWVLAWGIKVMGIVMTAFAVCLGAPFWFDLLNKLVKLRGSKTAAAETAETPEAKGSETVQVSVSPGVRTASSGSAPAASPGAPALPKREAFDVELRKPAGAFSQAKASWLGAAADLSYESAEEFQRRVRLDFGPEVSVTPICNEKTDTQAFMVLATGVAVLVFRGTEPRQVEDWLTDANTKLCRKDDFPGLVHTGFSRAFESIQVGLDAELAKLKGSGRMLYITGHSLGGALATLAAVRLVRSQAYAVQGVYTYGSPRAGNPEFAEAYDRLLLACTHRVVNNEDLVTRVAPRVLGYKHVGQIAYIDEAGKLRFDIGYWYRFLSLVADASASVQNALKTSFRDHSMVLYRQHLEKGLV